MAYYRPYLIILISFVCSSQNFAQFAKEEQISYFSSVISQAIKIDVLSHSEKITFYANNSSNYTYKVKLSFHSLNNLSPVIADKQFIVRPGNSSLISFTIVNKNEPHYYEYKTEYKINPSDDSIDETLLYLHPIGANKKLNTYISDASNFSYTNHFKMNSNDTVFVMRKGNIVALPDRKGNGDRLSNSESIEILHLDGTVMVYSGLRQEDVFVKNGQMVFPGQALGLMGNENLIVQLYKIQNVTNVLNIVFKILNDCMLDDLRNNTLSDCKSIYTEEIICKEMSNFEKRKFKKNKLY